MKNILFDFGGIFVDLDLDATNMGIQSYMGMGFKGLYHRYQEIFDGFETGHLSENEFIDSFANMGLPKNKIVSIWNSMLIGIPKNRIDFLKSLSGKYNLYLFSNTNSLHEKELDRLHQAHHGQGLKDFRQLFDNSWFSHDIGFRKPHKEGFEFILQETGIIPKETLFIDDSEQHLEGAKAVGMHTVLHDTSFDIANVFEEYVQRVSKLSL